MWRIRHIPGPMVARGGGCALQTGGCMSQRPGCAYRLGAEGSFHRRLTLRLEIPPKAPSSSGFA
jgi:hypothetical protein